MLLAQAWISPGAGLVVRPTAWLHAMQMQRASLSRRLPAVRKDAMESDNTSERLDPTRDTIPRRMVCPNSLDIGRRFPGGEHPDRMPAAKDMP
jgi:hypothetical protein